MTLYHNCQSIINKKQTRLDIFWYLISSFALFTMNHLQSTGKATSSKVLLYTVLICLLKAIRYTGTCDSDNFNRPLNLFP